MADGVIKKEITTDNVNDKSLNTLNTPIWFKFYIGQNVEIKEIRLPAKIAERYDCGGGIRMYKVIYWADNRRNVESLYESELKEGK